MRVVQKAFIIFQEKVFRQDGILMADNFFVVAYVNKQGDMSRSLHCLSQKKSPFGQCHIINLTVRFIASDESVKPPESDNFDRVVSFFLGYSTKSPKSTENQ